MSDTSVAHEISSALSDIVEHLEKKPNEQLRGALDEFGASLADIVAALEADRHSGAVELIVQAISKLKLAPSIQVAAPSVNVSVDPTPIVVQPPIVNIQAPEGGGWVFDVEYEDVGGRIKRLTAKRA